MRKTKAQKGITLIALIITIVVLLILAAVAINAITEYNIIENANSAAQKYGNQAQKEDETLGGYSSEIDKYLGGSTGGTGSSSAVTKTMTEVIGTIQPTNTRVFDEFGNQIVVPAGFMIRVDEDEGIKGDEKSTATNVTQGIVIEDEDENQFVWVPVGTIYTNTNRTQSKTITLGRYVYGREYNYETEKFGDDFFNDYVPDKNGVYTPSQKAENYATKIKILNDKYTEDTHENYILNYYGEYDIAIARNIGDFVTSAMQNGGYYIGRFEAGKEIESDDYYAGGKLACKPGQTVWVNYLDQHIPSTLCQNMYNQGADGYNAGTFSSDLINSYAWDTAIIFIQTFGGENEYYNQNKCTSVTTTGGNGDEYCNINDMSGNEREWTTESCGSGDTHRGGTFYSMPQETHGVTATRNGGTAGRDSAATFRPILYVAL